MMFAGTVCRYYLPILFADTFYNAKTLISDAHTLSRAKSQLRDEL